MAEWFEEWFGEEYLQLYPHRNEADAVRMVNLIQRFVSWVPGCRVLDVGCGAGRHASALKAAGARVTGLDLSLTLLRRAQREFHLPLVRADMRRLPIRDASMDLTVNLFTSFGYFSDDRQHQDALGDMIGTVRNDGWFVMDFLNAPSVRQHLVPEDSMQIGSEVVRMTRQLTDGGAYVVKTIEPPGRRRFVERVRLFDPSALEAMLDASGASVRHRFGDYDAGPLTVTSPRCILFAKKL
ncbi:MAG: class I SAM-dependent methyltransferase [Gemmatimonadota bacterium]